MKKNAGDPEVCSDFSLRVRRVVELDVLAEALEGDCEAGGTALRLSNCMNETVSGLESLLSGADYLHMLFKLRVWRDK